MGKRFYGLPDDPVYPGTSVLINRFDLHNQKDLDRCERILVSAREAELMLQILQGRYVVSHVSGIHRYLFSDVYPWAGQFRRIAIQKGDSEFCPYDRIAYELDSLSACISRSCPGQSLNLDTIAVYLTYIYSRLNWIHPFREGNGRVQRLLLCYLARKAGWDLDMSHVTANQMRNLSIAACKGNTRLMQTTIISSLSPWEELKWK